MTPEQPEFVELSKNVADIKAALCGDPLTGKIGYLGHTHNMMEDLYGLDPHGEPIESKKNTLLLRVSDVEDKQKKAFWVFGTIGAMLVAAKFGISALIEKYWK